MSDIPGLSSDDSVIYSFCWKNFWKRCRQIIFWWFCYLFLLLEGFLKTLLTDFCKIWRRDSSWYSDPEQLTRFWMPPSVGGSCVGVFNSVSMPH